MLIAFNEIVKKYGLPRGIIHIGAHLMEERNDYLSYGLTNTIWIEANPKIFESINFVNRELSKERSFNFAITDEGSTIVKMNVTNNGQSSSLLELDKHMIHHPHIYVSEIIDVETKRMDQLIEDFQIDINEYNFLNLDIQGLELKALKSFGKYIKNIDYIYTEVNSNSVYKDCCIIDEIDSFLDEYGFTRVETCMTQYEWGDALYLKKIDY